MEDQWLIAGLIIVYPIILSLVLLKYILRFGCKLVLLLMIAVHVFYALGVCVLVFVLWHSYHIVRDTEFGQRMENSIVHVNESKFLKDDSSLHRYIGEDVSFACKVPRSIQDSGLFFEWRRNGHAVTVDSLHVITNKSNGTLSRESKLRIHNIQESDFGSYTCGVLAAETMVFGDKWGQGTCLVNQNKLLPVNQNASLMKFNYSVISRFRLKQITKRTDAIFLSPGSILRLEVNYHSLISDTSELSIIYTINERPITSHDDRQLFTKCSFFIYNYWLLFEYGTVLFQLNTTTITSQRQLGVLKADTNFCIKDEFFGSYRFFIQRRYLDPETKLIKLFQIQYPVTFQILPKRPDLFDSQMFTLIPSSVKVNNDTQQCWTEPAFKMADYCDEILERFKDIPFLFFALEGFIFFPLLFLGYHCFTWYVSFLNWLFLKVFCDLLQLDSQFQVIYQDGRDLPQAIDSPAPTTGQIFFSCLSLDDPEAVVILDLLNCIVKENSLNVTVAKKDDVALGGSLLTGLLDSGIGNSDAFIIYSTDGYWTSMETELELAGISNKIKELPAERLLILRRSSAQPKAIGTSYKFCSWHVGLSRTAKKYLLTKWMMSVEKNRTTEGK